MMDKANVNQYILTHLLKIVTMSSGRLDHSLELDDLALQDKRIPAFMLGPMQESYIQCA